MAKDLYELELHPFYLEVDRNYIPIVQKTKAQITDLDEMFAKRSVSKGIHFTPQEYYWYSVFGKLITFSNVYRNLQFAQLYVSELKSPRKYERYGIHKFDYLTYHYSIYVLSYTSILDVALILTSTVFQLGLKDEKCKYDIVMKKVKSQSIRSDLERMKLTTAKYRGIRNHFLHHGKLPSIVDINNSEELYFLQLFKSQSKKIQKIKSDYGNAIELMYKIESKNILDKLNTDLILLQNAVSELFSHLLVIYSLANAQYMKDTSV